MKEQDDKRKHQRLAGNEYVDIHVARRRRFDDGPSVLTFTHPRKIPDPRAAFAMQCIERWAMIAGKSDGEDSAGRAKVRRMTSAEIVDHACQVAEAAFGEFTARGWLMDQPPYEEFIDAAKDQENSND